MPISLPEVTSGYNLSLINDNFNTIESQWDEKLDRLQSQQGNQMEQELDMNSNRIINHPPARIDPKVATDIVTVGDLTKLGDYSGVIPVHVAYVGDGTNTSFLKPVAGLSNAEGFGVYLGGLRQEPNKDYVVSGDYIIFSTAPVADLEVDIYASNPVILENGAPVYAEPILGNFVGDGSTTVFSVQASGSTTQSTFISIDGVNQTPGTDFTNVGGQITFTSAPPANSEIFVRIFSPLLPPDSRVGILPFATVSSMLAYPWANETIGQQISVQGTMFTHKTVSSPITLADFDLTSDIMIVSFGAIASGDESTKVNEAITAAGIYNGAKINLNGLELYTPTLSNPHGVELYNGACNIDNTTGVLQKNSYADKKRHFGYEYLFKINRSVESFRTTQPSWFVYGDSTVAGGFGEYRKPEQILNELMSVKGISNVSVTNRGVSGTRIGDLNAIPDLGTNTSAIFIKYGINDADLPLATFRDTLDSKLAEIRANANGSMSDLTVVLVGPNTTNEPSTGKTSLWYEKLRGIYEWAARKHQCFYFDSYSVLQDAQGSATVWLDNQNGDGRGVHPINNTNYWIWGRLLDEILPESSIYNYATNISRNTLGAVDVADVNTTPANYPFGKLVQQALATNGWPYDGLVITNKGADGIVSQKLVTLESRPLSISRNGNSGGPFGSWTGHRGGITLQNNWTNKTGYLPASYSMTEGGLVTLSGTIEGGTTGGGIVVGNVPAGFRPTAAANFVCPIPNGTCTLVVSPDGNITEFGANATQTSLDGITFSVF